MFRAILKTAISSLGLLFFISFFLFLLIYFLPGNVTDAMFLRSEAMSVAIKEQILENLGLKDGFFVQYFRGNTIEGWATLAISIWGIGGLMQMSIGIIGEYIGKIYLEVKHRPRYFIERVLD